MTSTDIESRLQALLAEVRGVSAEPFAATAADGFPTDVTGGELIESAWGDAVAAKLNKVPRGLIVQSVKPGDSGGNGTPEFTIPGLSFTTPAVTTSPARVYVVHYNVHVTIQTAITSGYIWLGLRQGTTIGGTLVGIGTYHNVPSSGTGPGPGLHLIGTSAATGSAANTTYTLCTLSGAGTYTVKSSSFIQLHDVGAAGGIYT